MKPPTAAHAPTISNQSTLIDRIKGDAG